MVADCWSIVATENLESKNNGSRQRRKEHLKEEIIRQNTESKKGREQLQRSVDVNLLKIQCWNVLELFTVDLWFVSLQQKSWKRNAWIRSKITSRNRRQTMPNWSNKIGSRSAPGCHGSLGVLLFLAPFDRKWRSKGPIWISGKSQMVQNHTFGLRSALGASKNDLWKSVWKKH